MNSSKPVVNALSRIHEVVKLNNANIIKSEDMKRSDRELLIRTHWLQEIIRGWYMLVKPDILPNDSTTWYANFWDFLRLYLKHRFGTEYCLSAENSLELHTNIPSIPRQIVVIVPHGGSGTSINFPFDTSLLIYADAKNIPPERIEVKGLQVMPLSLALCKVAPRFFTKDPKEAEIALQAVRSASELSRTILQYDLKRAAARIIAAYRFLQNEEMAQEIESDLMAAGIKISGENPFENGTTAFVHSKTYSPYSNRIVALWSKLKVTIVNSFPHPPGRPQNVKAYMKHVEDIYEQDAYNSLSIEGYQVSPCLLERVQNDNWNPDMYSEDKDERNALAARGYFEAFQIVKSSVEKILSGTNPGVIIEKELKLWYQALFSSSVQAGILDNKDLIGYRNGQVFIRNSRHVPPPREALLDSMETFFECLKNESHAGVRAILGHYIFVFIHPYMDGNGRLARFIMNAMLASEGYPWTIIELKNRNQYMNSLETAGIDQNIQPFVELVTQEMTKNW